MSLLWLDQDLGLCYVDGESVMNVCSGKVVCSVHRPGCSCHQRIEALWFESFGTSSWPFLMVGESTHPCFNSPVMGKRSERSVWCWIKPIIPSCRVWMNAMNFSGIHSVWGPTTWLVLKHCQTLIQDHRKSFLSGFAALRTFPRFVSQWKSYQWSSVGSKTTSTIREEIYFSNCCC